MNPGETTLFVPLGPEDRKSLLASAVRNEMNQEELGRGLAALKPRLPSPAHFSSPPPLPLA